MIGIAAGDRVILELAEMPRERDVLGARYVLVAKEQNLVLQQKRADFRQQRTITRRDTEIHIADLGADRAGQRFDPRGSDPELPRVHKWVPCRVTDIRARHGVSSPLWR